MASIDRAECVAGVELIYASYDKPCQDRHRESYWKTLAKMNTHDFARVMEHCLSEDAPEKVPSAGDCWRIAKRLRPARQDGRDFTQPVAELDDVQKAAAMRLADYIHNHVRGTTLDAGRYGSVRWVAGNGAHHFVGRLEISQSMHERVAVLVRAKNAYIERIRGDHTLADPELAQAVWDRMLREAEREIDDFVAEEQGTLL